MAVGQELYMFIVYLMLASVGINKAFGGPKRQVGSSSVPDECALFAEVTSNTKRVSYSEAIRDLVTKFNGLYNDANKVKNFLLTEYGSIYLDPDVAGYFDTKEFMDRSGIMDSSGMLDITSSVEQMIETLKLHYEFVHEQIVYVNATRTKGTLSENSLALLDYERSLYRSLCSIRLALMTAGYTDEVSTNIVVFHEEFEEYSDGIEFDVFRAYIVVGDGLVLSSNLKEAYVSMLV